MKRLLSLISATALASPTFATLVDFNAISNGTIISGAGAVSTDFTISGVSPGNPVVRALSGSPNGTVGGLQDSTRSGYRIDFNILGVGSVSVDIGDFNQDSENIYLQAYSSANVLLNQSTFALPSSQQTFQNLAVSASNISYVLFGGDSGNQGAPNSVYFDNLNYDTGASVPDGGTTSLLLAFALSGLAGIKRLIQPR